ncbi:MAG: metallophosphoesterase [Bacteroidales bacterium]
MKYKKQIITIIITAVIIIAAGGLIKSRWNVWFGNPPEYPYQPTEVPMRILMTYGCNGELSRMFTWIYGDKAEEGRVEITNNRTGATTILKAHSKIFSSRAGRAAYYCASVDSLSYASSYSYRILHPTDTTELYHFRVPAKGEKTEFIFIGDVQDTLGGISGKLFSEIELRNPDAGFYLFGGDVIERPMSCYWDQWFASMGTIPQTKPILAVPGNHEYLKGFPPYLEERFSLVFPYSKEISSGDNFLFHTDVGDIAIFMLDSNKEFWTYPAQRRWLKLQMESSKALWKVVVLHHPIFSMRNQFNNILQRMAFNPIIKKYGVDLVLQGHEHAYMRKAMINAERKETTPIYITSHTSPKNYRIGFSGNSQRLGGGDRYYQRISAIGDTLTVETFNSHHELYDKIVILKTKAGKQVKDCATGIPEKIEITPDMVRNTKKALKYKSEIDAYFGNKSK